MFTKNSVVLCGSLVAILSSLFVQLPGHAESFSKIRFCNSDKDREKLYVAYLSYDAQNGWESHGWYTQSVNCRQIQFTVISNTAFNQLMDALRRSWPKYLEFLAQTVPQNYFTSAQASQIIKEMNFGDQQVKAAVMLYPQVVDRGNWFIVDQAITFESDRQELRRQLGNFEPTPDSKPASPPDSKPASPPDSKPASPPDSRPASPPDSRP
ncbi:MAG: DUF4476 domain-containing protein [Nostoc sp. ChiQUE02]|uniref:DUF4476 domain-containing protein n=1 Tax=Nostoc sp. ChiQUE02 TaxID=3075377 RepID=UPI002AD27B24|nr:DUF4476 domain-containing protein [Nostoc sp. ChiQUE02]MDZ8229260.1 DUF4476 domain-containing protein [Nostoc sp. ChiQUE02]